MLEVIDLHKTYESQLLLKGVSFSLAEGETICLLGPSGSGKSTILRIIAGLEQPETGQIRWDGQNLANVSTHQRNFGLMFQDYALFPHLNVFENVAFGLRMQKKPDDELRRRVEEVLGQVNMGGFDKRSVTELSGGEQQRVALARALAPRPRLLMFDEPLGALDRGLRETLLDELRLILHRSRIPAIYVTHDQQEASAIADRIILLHEGQIAQAGAVSEVFAKPANGWVARFLGLGNVVEGRVDASGVGTSFGQIHIQSNRPIGESVTLLLRPRATVVEKDETLSGTVVDLVFREQAFRIELQGGLYFYIPEPVSVGENVKLKIAQIEVL